MGNTDKNNEQIDETINTGPYNVKQFTELDRLNELRNRLIVAQMPNNIMPTDGEEVNTLASLIRDAETSIHKTANSISKHDVGVSQATSAETIAEYIMQIQMESSEEFKRGNFHNKESITQDDVPKIVSGQKFDGIQKPTLKDIMATDMNDDE